MQGEGQSIPFPTSPGHSALFAQAGSTEEGAPPDGPQGRVTPYSEYQELVVGRLLGGLPQIACNGCAAAESCPDFEENSSCAYDEDFGGLSTRDLDNLLPRMEVIADMQFKRGMHAAYVERRKSGGQLLPEVTRQLEIAAAAAERVARLKTPQTRTAGSPVVVVQQNNSGGQASGGGLVSRLLAGIAGKSTSQHSGEISINEKNSELPEHVRQPIEAPLVGDGEIVEVGMGARDPNYEVNT